MRILKRLITLSAERCVMKEERRQRLVLRESHIILKYARFWPLEGGASGEAGWLRFMSLCHTALARGLRKWANDLPMFLTIAWATCEGVYGLVYMPLMARRVCASSVRISIDWRGWQLESQNWRRMR